MVQVPFLNGERFRRTRKIVLVPRPKTHLLLPPAMLQTNLESLAEVELALTLAEEVVVVAQSVAEEGEVVELRSHIQTVLTTRKTSLI